jgi:uncharacterized membrane protein (DUF485 family)
MQSPEPPPAPEPAAPAHDIHSESFLRLLMARQLKLSIACALTFLIALLGLPLANFFWPDLMATRVLGFTLTWLVLGVLFFPFVWIISYVFIRRSIALERAEVEEVANGSKAVSQSVSGSESAP